VETAFGRALLGCLSVIDIGNVEKRTVVFCHRLATFGVWSGLEQEWRFFDLADNALDYARRPRSLIQTILANRGNESVET
jgi:hypothetical protein